jgi:serine protease SohB
VWSGEDAIRLKLVDEIGTSDAYIVKNCDEADVYSVKYEEKKPIHEKFGAAAAVAADRIVDQLMQRFDKTRFL